MDLTWWTDLAEFYQRLHSITRPRSNCIAGNGYFAPLAMYIIDVINHLSLCLRGKLFLTDRDLEKAKREQGCLVRENKKTDSLPKPSNAVIDSLGTAG